MWLLTFEEGCSILDGDNTVGDGGDCYNAGLAGNQLLLKKAGQLVRTKVVSLQYGVHKLQGWIMRS